LEDNKEILVEVNNVSKKFCKDLKLSLQYGLMDSIKAVLPFKKTDNTALRKKEFWAVKNINFTLRRGECIGLIGHNGAGKSTLLKILNGLILPDTGSVTLRGKVGALIELGAGFNPILTGRENIYNNAAVLGFAKKEVDSKLESIIAFSEIEDFIDTPVQNYSSGMKVRLGFAIAAHLEPDILIIDEVLAVGDLGFVLKCFKTIDELLPNTAIIFVSHSMPMVSRICNEIILMDKGQVKFQGKHVSKGIDMYYSKFAQGDQNIVYTDNSIELIETVINNSNEKLPQLNWNQNISISISINNISLTEFPYITLSIFDKEQRGIATFNVKPIQKKIDKGVLKIEIAHQNLQLSKGIYSLNVSIAEKKGSNPLLRVNGIKSFQVTHEEQTWPPFLLEAEIKQVL
jgi:lipopolysaccharide transport system ATP-binding protein